MPAAQNRRWFSRRKKEPESEFSKREDTGAMRKLVDDAVGENRAASKLLQAALKPASKKFVLVVTRKIERALRIRQLLVERDLCDAARVASDEESAREIIDDRNVALVVAEEEFAGACREALQSRSGRLFVIGGRDDEDAVAEAAHLL